MNLELQLHEKSRWSSAGNRKVNAARAIQDRDEVALFGLLEAYLRARSKKRAAISPRTVLRYTHALKHFFDFTWQPGSTINLLQIDEPALEAFLERLSERDPAALIGTGRRVLSRSAIDLCVVATKALFRALVWTGVLTRDPTTDLRSPDVARSERQPVLASEQIDALKALEPHRDPVIAARDAAMLELGLSTMLRADEIVRLDVQDVDLIHGVVQVLGKGNKLRSLPLTRAPREAVECWLAVRGELVTRRSASALILSASRRNRGARIGYGGVYATLRTAFAHLELGQDGMHLGGMHTLRRSGATRFHARNRDLLTLARLLGHASLTTTQRYVRLELSTLREALEAVEETPDF